MAIGILSFCAVSLMGLLPVMLNISRESRETATVSRIYQTVAADLRADPRTSPQTWNFDAQGGALSNATGAHYAVTASAPQPAAVGASSNACIHMMKVVVDNVPRAKTVLVRPLFVSYGTNSTP